MWLQKGQSHWLFFAKFNKVKTCFHVHVCARLALRSDQTRCLPLVCGVGWRSGNIFQPLLKSHCRHQRLWRTEQNWEKGESSKAEGKNDKRVRRRSWERRDLSSVASVWRLLWQVAGVQTGAGWGEGLPAILTEVYTESFGKSERVLTPAQQNVNPVFWTVKDEQVTREDCSTRSLPLADERDGSQSLQISEPSGCKCNCQQIKAALV